MSDLDVIYESNNVWNVFLPIGGESQLSLCRLLRLPLIVNNFEMSSKPLGDPIKIFSINGDGNCLFRSFSYAITGRQNYHRLIRKKIVDYMKTIEHALLPHIGTSVQEYLTRSKMNCDGVWGTDIEILTAASLFCIDIYVYTKLGNYSRWNKFSRCMLQEPLPDDNHAIYIQNISQVHFDVVKDVSRNFVHNTSAAISAHNFATKSSILSSTRDFNTCLSTLKNRLLVKNLRPLVCGDGGCFFKAVSHQLYHRSEYHQSVRKAGIDYISTFPEQFIESIANSCWNDYITNMSAQGTWCDAIIVQAVANSLNCIIDITESALNFNETTIVYPACYKEKPKRIYIGHLSEFHYVSTITLHALKCKQESQINIADHNYHTAIGDSYIAGKNKSKRCLDTQSEGKAPQKKKCVFF